MNELPTPSYDYQIEGGALLIDSPTYVRRQADDVLYQSLQAGKFCYVLNARQMGKSSLKVRTMQRLQESGVICAAVDLQGVGTSVTEEQWYVSIINRIARGLGLRRQFNLNAWWPEHALLSNVQRFTLFLETVLLQAIAQPVVIFIDEVDLTLSLPFSSDDFFGALRECYNRRADEPQFRRLSFALLGVATPADLIQNKQITPFNIGQPIELTGFKLEDAAPLLPGLAAKSESPQAVLQAVLDWTGGQPFLTQKVCKLLLTSESAPLDGQESKWVEQVVQSQVIENWEAQDTPQHLITIRDRLVQSDDQQKGRLLGLYQQIMQQGEVAADDSSEQMTLRLTGLVVKQNSKLRVYNRIYAQVFNHDWLERELARLRPYGEAISSWLASTQQDDSRLLRGDALRDALAWSADKSLGDDDYRFLNASQDLENRDVQQRLAAEAEANEILLTARQQAELELETATQKLKIVNKQVRQQVSIGGAVLAASLIWVGFSSFTAKRAMETAAKAAQITQIEEQSRAALRLFDLNQTESLITAIEAGQSLQLLLSQSSGNDSIRTRFSQIRYPTRSVRMTLQQVLSNIQIRQVAALQGSVNSLSWTSDGKTLAIAGDDTTVKLLDSEGTPIQEIQANQGKVYSLDWTSDGRILATAGSGSTVKLWTQEGTLIKAIQTEQGRISSLDWAPDGEILATGGDNDAVNLWSREGTLITTIQTGQRNIGSLSWTPDGRILATAGGNGTAKLWDRQGRLVKEIQVNPSERVSSLAWAPDGQTLATGSHFQVKLWKREGSFIREIRTYQDWVHSISWAPDGQLIATGGEDGSTKIWSLNGTLTNSINVGQGTIWSINWSPNGESLAIGGQGRHAILWGFTKQLVTEIKADQGEYYSLDWAPDGQLLASGGDDGSVKLWGRSGTLITKIQAHQGRVWSIGWTPDGEILATGGDDGNAKLWRHDGTFITDIPANQGWAFSLSWSTDGQTLATTGGSSKTIKLWRRDGTIIREFKTDQEIVRNVRWVGGEKIISTAAEDGSIKLWQEDGTLIQNIQAYHIKVWSMDWSPDGEILAVGADNGLVKLFKRDGTLIAEIQAHYGIVWTVKWSADGQTLATSGNDGTIRLWNRSGDSVLESQTYQGSIYGVDWSNDGHTLAAGGHDGTIKLWVFEDLDTLLTKGCSWLESYLITSPQTLERVTICKSLRSKHD